MKFENTRVFNFEGAIRGMRNPLESWDRSDSDFGIVETDDEAYEVVNNQFYEYHDMSKEWTDEEWEDWQEAYKTNCFSNTFLGSEHYYEYAAIGPNDLDLMKRLVLGGDEHAKFMRQIFVSVDITAPLLFWKEFDTYKIGTTANSTSTMHTIHKKPITLDCFEISDMWTEKELQFWNNVLLPHLNSLREDYLVTKDKRYWLELIRLLPESWLQTRTWTGSYANLRNMRRQREYHKLDYWKKDFINWEKTLPYANELIFS